MSLRDTLPLGPTLFQSIANKSSHWRCFFKKGVLKNVAKSTAKYLRQILFFNKVAGLRPQPASSIKKRL